MSLLDRELETNFASFSDAWKAELQQVISQLSQSSQTYQESYKRIATLNAWRESVLVSKISSMSLEFFVEAQNDALVSHVFARMGAWRSALKSLRSCIENVLFTLYYKDHPVELELWQMGSHQLQFSELFAYVSRHPTLVGLEEAATGLEVMKKEYAVLSRAVHGSAASFRMTAAAGSTQLWRSDTALLGSWKAREIATLRSLNLLLIAIYRDTLAGTQHSGLREVLSLTFPARERQRIKATFGVVLH